MMTFDGEQEEDNDEDKDEEEGDEEEDEEDVKEEVNLSSSQEEVLTALQMQTHCPRTAAHGPSQSAAGAPCLEEPAQQLRRPARQPQGNHQQQLVGSARNATAHLSTVKKEEPDMAEAPGISGRRTKKARRVVEPVFKEE